MQNVSILIKPASGLCNMRCSYCFYRDISAQRQAEVQKVKSLQTLARVVKEAMRMAERSCSFVFQGGEPTLAGLHFFRELIRLQKKYNDKCLEVQNAIQTNGLLIDQKWAEFFKENHFLVGLSIDGTKSIHDQFRCDTAGNGTYQKVVRAAQLLDKFGVDYNILTVVTKQIANHAQAVYNSCKRNGWKYLQFIPCLDHYGAPRGEEYYSLTPADYGKFLKALFDCWYQDMICGEYVYIRYFENIMGILAGIEPESCGLCGQCSAQIVVEADGSVYPCDFYVMNHYCMGSFSQHTLEEILTHENASRFVEESRIVQPACLSCKWGALCRGGCRRDRDSGSSLEQNYYCSSYQSFFEYAIERLLKLKPNYQ